MSAAPSALAVFIARCEARALLWQAGELDLHEAVDELQTVAVRDGLVSELGQDEVQRLMVEAFAPLRNDLVVQHEAADEDDYSDPSSTFDAACRAADEKQRLKPPKRSLPAEHLPVSTRRAAEYLVCEGDPEQLRQWLAKHSRAERIAILEYLEQRQVRRRKAAA